MNYIGIQQSRYKRRLIRNWKKGKRIKISTSLLVSKDCNRHLELLSLFDDFSSLPPKAKLKKTSYYKFQRKKGTRTNALQRVKKFYRLYGSIKKHGYKRKKGGYIIVSSEGARLDGSHRVAIAYHIGIKELETVVLNWAKILSPIDLKNMRRHLEIQKKRYA